MSTIAHGGRHIHLRPYFQYFDFAAPLMVPLGQFISWLLLILVLSLPSNWRACPPKPRRRAPYVPADGAGKADAPGFAVFAKAGPPMTFSFSEISNLKYEIPLLRPHCSAASQPATCTNGQGYYNWSKSILALY